MERGAVYRGRIAPTPTGDLHVGHARTFMWAARRAESAEGALVLRIEDHVVRRSSLDHVAAEQHDDVIREVPRGREVVRDVEHAEVAFGLQLGQQVEHA